MKRMMLIVFFISATIIVTGCSNVKGIFDRTSQVVKEIEDKGGIRVILEAQRKNGEVPYENQLELVKKILKYRIESMGRMKQLININEQDCIVIEFVSNDNLSISKLQPILDQVTKKGFLTTQEIDQNKIDGKGMYLPTDKVLFDGMDIKDVSVYSEKDNQCNIMIELNDKAAKTFEELTEKLTGKPVGIFIDDQLIAAPVIQSKITGGVLVLSGIGSKEDALDLSIILKSGPLPFDLDIKSIEMVNPKKK